VFDNEMLRRIFEGKRMGIQENGENYKMKN
jgi:hypothetical protein